MKFLEKGLKKKILIAALAYINSVSIAYYMAQGNQTSYYYGLTFFGWNPSCIAFFALAVILLLRFFNKEVLSNKKRVVASTILGALFSYTALWGTYMLYGTNSIFDSTPKIILGFLAPIGMMILIVPAFSECFGLVDRLRTEQCDRSTENAENIGNESVDSTQSVVLKGKRITSDFLYAVIMWIVFFLKFGVMFLLYWPVVLCYDASYQLSEYVNKSFSTHHPFLHTFLLGKCYDLGLKIGNLELGISVYTLIQMTVLSASFAFFMYFLRKFEKRKWVRVVTFVLFLNPVHGYFSQTTTKGTLCGAFTLLALTCFLFYLKERRKTLNLVLFVAFSVLACQFRNNMIYAVVVAGIIIIICIKGLKKKGLMLLLFALIFLGNKATTKIFTDAYNIRTVDSTKESMSLPAMCLARVMINHKDEIPPEEYHALTTFISEESLNDYSMIIADQIKNPMDETHLKEYLSTFLKKWIKFGLKYPGEYIEQFVALTLGYWYPLDSPTFLYGSTGIYTMPVIDNVVQPGSKDLTGIGRTFLNWYSIVDDGRQMIPLLGWLWRGAPYFWGYLFALTYALYSKNKRAMMIISIPFMYFLTCFLGPVSWLRYIYVDIVCIPSLVYALTNNDGDMN